jgi:hypothetical protein
MSRNTAAFFGCILGAVSEILEKGKLLRCHPGGVGHRDY